MMDSPLPSEPDDVKSRPSMASGLLLSRVISAPEPRRPDGPFSPSFDRAPRKRESPMDGSNARPVAELPSPSDKHFWPSGGYSPRSGDLGEPPDKRPRLDYIPEKTETGEDSFRRRMLPQVCALRSPHPAVPAEE